LIQLWFTGVFGGGITCSTNQKYTPEISAIKKQEQEQEEQEEQE